MATTPENKNPQDPSNTGGFPLPLKIMISTIIIALLVVVLKTMGVF